MYFMNVKLPSMCTVCSKFSGDQIIPDRSIPEIHTNHNKLWWIDIMCPLCFDAFLGEYHHIFYKIKNKELKGKLKK